MKELVILSKKNILFLCTGNSCRSQIAEGFAKKYLSNYNISSAGTEAHGMNPNTIKTMNEMCIFLKKYPLIIATAIIGVKFGGWGISLEKTIRKIKPKANKFLPENSFNNLLFIITIY